MGRSLSYLTWTWFRLSSGQVVKMEFYSKTAMTNALSNCWPHDGATLAEDLDMAEGSRVYGLAEKVCASLLALRLRDRTSTMPVQECNLHLHCWRLHLCVCPRDPFGSITHTLMLKSRKRPRAYQLVTLRPRPARSATSSSGDAGLNQRPEGVSRLR